MSDSEMKISIVDGGPYKVEPGCELVGADGDPVKTREGKPFFLCRCGHSDNKPFCDGSHNQYDWENEDA